MQILHPVKAKLSQIKEIDFQLGLIIIHTESSIQVWNVLQDSVVHEFPSNPDLNFEFSSNSLIFWQTSENTISIGVLSMLSQTLKTITINAVGEVDLCEIVQDKLIVGVRNYDLQVIDLNTNVAQSIKKGPLKQYYRMTSKMTSIALFCDGNAVVIDKEISEVRVGTGNFTFTDLKGIGILCDKYGRIVFCDGVEREIQFVGKKVQAVGVNEDTQQILVAEKGVVHVIE